MSEANRTISEGLEALYYIRAVVVAMLVWQVKMCCYKQSL